MQSLQKLAGSLALACASLSSVALAQGVPGGKYAIQTVRGNYLTAINGGGISGRNPINTDATQVGGWETFTLVPQSDGTYAVQTANAYFVTALNGGGISGAVALHTNARTVSGWEKFAFVDQKDGTHAIRTSNGRFLTALSGGGIGGGAIAIHTNATTVNAWEKFKLVRLDGAPACSANLKDAWWYLVNSNPPVAFFVLTDNTWTSKEIGYGDATRRDYWGSYKCIGTNAWEFVTANGAVYQRLALRSDGTLYNSATNQVFKR